MKKVLFVCVENSCRSQIAEAFVNIYGKGVLSACSAGSNPSGQVSEKAIYSMNEIGYNLLIHESKCLNDVLDIDYDYAITMGCGDECHNVRARQNKVWSISDPKNMNRERFRKVREQIKYKVLSLIEEIKKSGEI